MIRGARFRLLVLLVLPSVAFAKLSADEGSSCTSSQGWDGLCMMSYECTGLGELVVKGYTPELCNTAGPVVCCPLPGQEIVSIMKPDQNAEIRPGLISSSTSRPVNISPSPTPYVAEESQTHVRKVSIPTMRIRRKRPSMKRHAHILLKTYDDEVNSILIRTHRIKPTHSSVGGRRRKRRPGSSIPSRLKHYGHGVSRSSFKNHHSPENYQTSLATQLAEAKFEADQEAALLLADMSNSHSVSIYPSRTTIATSPFATSTQMPSVSSSYTSTSIAPTISSIAESVTPFSAAPQLRISRIMCDAYSEAMMETVAELSKKGVVPKKTEKCTLTSMMPNSKTTAALVGEFPHVVGLGYSDPGLRTVWGKCSGILVSEEFVLTAAHCTHAPAGRPVSVGLGSKTLASDSEISIREVIVHPQYNRTTYGHDIALIRLARRTLLSDTLRPACLPTSHSIPRSLIASHWSNMPPMTMEIRTSRNETHLFSNPDVMGLQKEKMTLLKNKDCDINKDLAESFLCAQSAVNRRNDEEDCQGYGGDALQYRNSGNKCMYTLVGVAVENVCEESSPIAFTKVYQYLNWIETVVWG